MDRVQNLVVEDHKPALARAPVLLRPMAAENAVEKMNDHVSVIRSFAPVS